MQAVRLQEVGNLGHEEMPEPPLPGPEGVTLAVSIPGIWTELAQVTAMLPDLAPHLDALTRQKVEPADVPGTYNALIERRGPGIEGLIACAGS